MNSFCNICTDMCAIDIFSVTHFIAGIFMYQLNISLFWTNILHAVYELLNHLPSNDMIIRGCEYLRKSIPIIPHCNLFPVAWSNSIFDQLIANIGWIVASYTLLPKFPRMIQRFWIPIVIVMPLVLMLSFEYIRLNVLKIDPTECKTKFGVS